MTIFIFKLHSLLCSLKDKLLALRSFSEVGRMFLMPSICASCKIFLSHDAIFCVSCKDKIFPIVSKNIDITPTFSMTVFAISDYTDPLKKLILAKNWSDSLPSHQLGQLLWESMPALQALDCDVIVPIPLHWTRYAWRGFNQAQEIAYVISKKKNIPIKHLLKRVKRTAFQSTLVSGMRVENLKEAFVLNDAFIKECAGKHILLVDDLMTTGSTLRSAAKTLLALKPQKMSVAVICRVI